MKRLALAHLPTPLHQPKKLAEAMGIDLWVKRDDASAGAAAGNKIRKLEFILADALAQECDTVITCGGIQSNHARTTAILAARLGLRAILMLRLPELTDDRQGAGVPLDKKKISPKGNVLIDCMVGADIRLITPQSYQRRTALMQAAAEQLREQGAKPYIIPEGGSNGLGAMGYVEAMREIREQLDLGAAEGKAFDVIVHACGSGGTSAGVALGAKQYQVAPHLIAMAVCDDEPTFEQRITDIIDECRHHDPQLGEAVSWQVDASAKGPAYAISTEAQRSCMLETAQLSGLLLDPVYTGKAFFGLWNLCRAGELQKQRVLFLHTGGLPGLLAQPHAFASHW